MATPSPVTIEKKSALGLVLAFMLHTYLAYTCAMHLSQWLVFHWFGWIAPILHISTNIPPADWYLQHFESMTILPALVMGLTNVARFLPDMLRISLHEGHHSIASWTWVVPTLVLLYRMLGYHAPASVLYGGSMTALKYFFDIQTVMPTLQNPLASDPIRLWKQLSVTAPFYAGVAYSLGAFVSNHQLLTRFFRFETHAETNPQEP